MTSVDPDPPGAAPGARARVAPSAEALDPRLSPRGKILLPLGLLLLVGFTVHRFFFADPPPMAVDITGGTMGTTFSVRLDVDALDADERASVTRAVRARLDEVDGLMSTYDPASELSHFNASRSTEPVPMSPPTLSVLEIAQDVSARSGGALDVTLGPLIEAWGFGAPGQPPEPPSSASLAELGERVGYTLLDVDRAAGTLSKRHPATEVNLSAVAKGYAVDRVAAALDSLGYDRYLVEVGGELRAGAAKRDGSPWRVAIETPDASIRAVFGVVELVRESIATSGDYRNFYEIDGVRYAHLIEPRTGRPVGHAGASVSVLHPRNALADAWATALSVLGVDEGFELAEREGLAALFIMRSDDGFEARATTEFRARQAVPGEQR